MNIGSQIKKYRMELALSQEEFADKIFVSRQSVSNWENDKTYPDIKSLLLMADLFSISLDELIKGDVEMMKEEIDLQEKMKFEKDSKILTVFMVLLLITPVFLMEYLGKIGIGIYVVICLIGFYYAYKVEKHKKRFNIQTYKEIIAFTEGKTLTKEEKSEEKGKRPYQKILLPIGAAIISFMVSIILFTIVSYFKFN